MKKILQNSTTIILNIFNIILGVFSGRPNPTWTLTKEQVILFLNNVSLIEPTTKNWKIILKKYFDIVFL